MIANADRLQAHTTDDLPPSEISTAAEKRQQDLLDRMAETRRKLDATIASFDGGDAVQGSDEDAAEKNNKDSNDTESESEERQQALLDRMVTVLLSVALRSFSLRSYLFPTMYRACL